MSGKNIEWKLIQNKTDEKLNDLALLYINILVDKILTKHSKN